MLYINIDIAHLINYNTAYSYIINNIYICNKNEYHILSENYTFRIYRKLHI